MAGRLPFTFTFILLSTFFSSLALALQVTPNSPCASFCLDDADLDKSDPDSSNTNGTDIVCSDEDFTRDTKGQKFQRCLSCLQDSTFQQGDENDQDWFLYNLRYSFDYCIFGYPNATDVGSNPCMTSEACGGIEAALKQDILEPTDREQYGYCGGSGKNVLADVVERCRSCVKADRTHSYLSNFLVALEAGCQQQPIPGHIIGLNDTVFTKTTIQITNPSLSTTTKSSNIHLATGAIVGIVIGALVVLLVAAGCIFMQCRKRKNRANRAMRARHLRASSLSFRCQTHLSTPKEAGFRHFDDESLPEKEGVAVTDTSLWNPKNAMSSLRTGQKLTNITTSLPSPAYIHPSPKIGSPDDYTTPTSAISVRSDKPLLYQKPHMQSPATSSPLASPGLTMSWEDQKVTGQRDLMRQKGSWGVVAPVEARNIQTKFPPPPKK